MKKLIIVSATVLMLSSGYAIAEDSVAQAEKPQKEMRKHKLDTNGDGVVSKTEFLAHAEERFAKIDKDGSGDISKEEGRAAHKKMREMKKEMGEKRKDRKEKRASAETSE